MMENGGGCWLEIKRERNTQGGRGEKRGGMVSEKKAMKSEERVSGRGGELRESRGGDASTSTLKELMRLHSWMFKWAFLAWRII